MKYKKLQLYKLSPSEINEAICADGNFASGSSCLSGPDAGTGCKSGAAAGTNCKSGAAAANSCLDGVGFED